MAYIQKPKSLFEIRYSNMRFETLWDSKNEIYVRDSISKLTDEIIDLKTSSLALSSFYIWRSSIHALTYKKKTVVLSLAKWSCVWLISGYMNRLVDIKCVLRI